MALVDESAGRGGSASGLTEPEAREFQRIFLMSFAVFVGIALVAHFLAWQWRPWGGTYTTSMLDDARGVATHLLTYLA